MFVLPHLDHRAALSDVDGLWKYLYSTGEHHGPAVSARLDSGPWGLLFSFSVRAKACV